MFQSDKYLLTLLITCMYCLTSFCITPLVFEDYRPPEMYAKICLWIQLTLGYYENRSRNIISIEPRGPLI